MEAAGATDNNFGRPDTSVDKYLVTRFSSPGLSTGRPGGVQARDAKKAPKGLF